ncbi:hypothetical protein DFH29DRAFT_968899, partial [Suillus ampliporus]
MAFSLAMVSYPDVQTRTSEIDSTFRWHPILPLGNLLSFSDSLYGRMGCMRYPNASHFMPERFIDVGRYILLMPLYGCYCDHVGYVDFSLAKDDQGNVIEFTPNSQTGITHTVVVFPCNISPRSHIHSELVDVFRTGS